MSTYNTTTCSGPGQTEVQQRPIGGVPPPAILAGDDGACLLLFSFSFKGSRSKGRKNVLPFSFLSLIFFFVSYT